MPHPFFRYYHQHTQIPNSSKYKISNIFLFQANAMSFGWILWNFLGVVTALLAVSFAYFKWTYQYWKKKNVPYFEPKIPFGNLSNPFRVPLGDAIAEIYKKAKEKGQ